jgi:hypothetical protein
MFQYIYHDSIGENKSLFLPNNENELVKIYNPIVITELVNPSNTIQFQLLIYVIRSILYPNESFLENIYFLIDHYEYQAAKSGLTIHQMTVDEYKQELIHDYEMCIHSLNAIVFK